jgi:hypothetical protein
LLSNFSSLLALLIKYVINNEGMSRPDACQAGIVGVDLGQLVEAYPRCSKFGRDAMLAVFQLLKDVAMPSQYKTDPYNGFKSDVERRRALNMRAICLAIVGVAFSQSPWAANLKEILPWLKTLFT